MIHLAMDIALLQLYITAIVSYCSCQYDNYEHCSCQYDKYEQCSCQWDSTVIVYDHRAFIWLATSRIGHN